MKAQTKIDLFIISLVMLVVLMAVSPAWAGGPDVEQNVDVSLTGGAVDVAGDTLNLSTGGNRAYNVVAPGLGDVDIAQCLGSTQWSLLIGGKQKLVLNQVCMAEFYLKQGRYDLAAQALCNQPEILMEYRTEVACEIDHDFKPAIIEGEDLYGLYDRAAQFDEHYEISQQQEQEIEYLQEENASIVGRLDALTAQLEAPRAQPAPVIAQQQAPPAQQYSDEDMAYILGLYADGESEDE